MRLVKDEVLHRQHLSFQSICKRQDLIGSTHDASERALRRYRQVIAGRSQEPGTNPVMWDQEPAVVEAHMGDHTARFVKVPENESQSVTHAPGNREFVRLDRLVVKLRGQRARNFVLWSCKGQGHAIAFAETPLLLQRKFYVLVRGVTRVLLCGREMWTSKSPCTSLSTRLFDLAPSAEATVSSDDTCCCECWLLHLGMRRESCRYSQMKD